MPIIRIRKPFKIGDSVAVALPPGHTLNDRDEVKLIADSIVVICPMDMSVDKLRQRMRDLADDIVG